MTHWTPDPDILAATRHQVDHQIALLEAVGSQRHADSRLTLCVPDADRDMARWLLTSRGVRLNGPWLMLHPGVAEDSRRYPAECFADVARTLLPEHGFQLVLTGGAFERAFCDQIAQHLTGHIVNLAGELSLGTLAGLIAEATTLLTNSTGPVHMAAALQTQVVVCTTPNPQFTTLAIGHLEKYSTVFVE